MKSINKTLDLWVWPLVAVLTYLAFQLIGQFVVTTVAFMSAEGGVMDYGEVTAWTMAVSTFCISVVLLILKPFRLYKEFRIWLCDNWRAFLGVVIVLLAIAGSNMMNEILEEWVGLEMDQEYQKMFEGVLQTPVGVLAIGFLGPICEEIVFRGGIMKPMLERNVNPWIPIGVSALIFGLAHGNLTQIIFATCVGLVFAIVYYRTRSLIITTACHIANNSLTILLMKSNENYADMKMSDYIGFWPLLVAFIIIFTLTIILTCHFWKQTGTPESIAPSDDNIIPQ